LSRKHTETRQIGNDLPRFAIRVAGPKQCHQAAKFAGRIETEGVFAVLKNGVRRQLSANLQEFFRGTPLLIGRECGELSIDLVDPLESFEVLEGMSLARLPRAAGLIGTFQLGDESSLLANQSGRFRPIVRDVPIGIPPQVAK
jgi:hypothetical protein